MNIPSAEEPVLMLSLFHKNCTSSVWIRAAGVNVSVVGRGHAIIVLHQLERLNNVHRNMHKTVLGLRYIMLVYGENDSIAE